jgi:hypothetical protein
MSSCLEHLYNYEVNLASDFGMKSEIYSLTAQVNGKQLLLLRITTTLTNTNRFPNKKGKMWFHLFASEWYLIICYNLIPVFCKKYVSGVL